MNDAATLADVSGGGGEFFEGEPTRECAVKREASRGIATSRDWGRAIDVGEAAAGGGSGDGDGLLKALGGTSCIFI